MSISYTRDLFMTRTGVHSGLEKHRFHQAEEPACSPDLRKGDQTFVFVCVSIKEIHHWLRFIKCADSKGYYFSNSITKCKTVVRFLKSSVSVHSAPAEH